MKKIIRWFYNGKPPLLLIVFTIFGAHSEESNDYRA